MSSVAYIQDYFPLNEDTKSIVDAINQSGKASADKIDEMQKSVSDLAKSVHELAISNRFLSEEVSSIKQEVKDLDKRVDKVEPVTDTMKAITGIFLKWMIPIMLVGSFGGGIAYTLLK